MLYKPEQELRDYFLYARNVRKCSRIASTIAIPSIKFFSPRKRVLLGHVKALFEVAARPAEQASALACVDAEPVMRCPKCGQVMLFVREISPQKIRAP